jgi:hypothetical protein
MRREDGWMGITKKKEEDEGGRKLRGRKNDNDQSGNQTDRRGRS